MVLTGLVLVLTGSGPGEQPHLQGASAGLPSPGGPAEALPVPQPADHSAQEPPLLIGGAPYPRQQH